MFLALFVNPHSLPLSLSLSLSRFLHFSLPPSLSSRPCQFSTIFAANARIFSSSFVSFGFAKTKRTSETWILEIRTARWPCETYRGIVIVRLAASGWLVCVAHQSRVVFGFRKHRIRIGLQIISRQLELLSISFDPPAAPRRAASSVSPYRHRDELLHVVESRNSRTAYSTSNWDSIYFYERTHYTSCVPSLHSEYARLLKVVPLREVVLSSLEVRFHRNEDECSDDDQMGPEPGVRQLRRRGRRCCRCRW